MKLISIFLCLLTGTALQAAEATWFYRWHNPGTHLYRLTISDGNTLLLFKGALDPGDFASLSGLAGNPGWEKAAGLNAHLAPAGWSPRVPPLSLLPAWGLHTTWLCYGPFVKSGLLRELDNYPRYSFYSQIFREKTGLKLDTALQPTEPRMLLLSPHPQLAHFFYLVFPEEKTIFGLFGNLPFDGGVRLESLCSATFNQDPALPPLLHGALRLMRDGQCFRSTSSLLFSLPAPSTEPLFTGLPAPPNKPLSPSLSAPPNKPLSPSLSTPPTELLSPGLSAPPNETFSPGLLAHLLLSWRLQRLAPGLLLEYCTPEYINPAGQPGRNWLKGQVVLDFYPVRGLSVGGSYKLEFPSPPQTYAAYLPASEQIRFSSRLQWGDLDRTGLLLEGVLLKNQEYTVLGCGTGSFRLEGKITFQTPGFSSVLEGSQVREGCSPSSRQWKSELSFSGKNWEMQLGGKLIQEDSLSCSGKVSLAFCAPEYTLQFQAAFKPEKVLTREKIPLFLQAPLTYLDLKISWQTKQTTKT